MSENADVVYTYTERKSQRRVSNTLNGFFKQYIETANEHATFSFAHDLVLYTNQKANRDILSLFQLRPSRLSTKPVEKNSIIQVKRTVIIDGHTQYVRTTGPTENRDLYICKHFASTTGGDSGSIVLDMNEFVVGIHTHSSNRNGETFNNFVNNTLILMMIDPDVEIIRKKDVQQETVVPQTQEVVVQETGTMTASSTISRTDEDDDRENRKADRRRGRDERDGNNERHANDYRQTVWRGDGEGDGYLKSWVKMKGEEIPTTTLVKQGKPVSAAAVANDKDILYVVITEKNEPLNARNMTLKKAAAYDQAVQAGNVQRWMEAQANHKVDVGSKQVEVTVMYAPDYAWMVSTNGINRKWGLQSYEACKEIIKSNKIETLKQWQTYMKTNDWNKNNAYVPVLTTGKAPNIVGNPLKEAYNPVHIFEAGQLPEFPEEFDIVPSEATIKQIRNIQMSVTNFTEILLQQTVIAAMAIKEHDVKAKDLQDAKMFLEKINKFKTICNRWKGEYQMISKQISKQQLASQKAIGEVAEEAANLLNTLDDVLTKLHTAVEQLDIEKLILQSTNIISNNELAVILTDNQNSKNLEITANTKALMEQIQTLTNQINEQKFKNEQNTNALIQMHRENEAKVQEMYEKHLAKAAQEHEQQYQQMYEKFEREREAMLQKHMSEKQALELKFHQNEARITIEKLQEKTKTETNAFAAQNQKLENRILNLEQQLLKKETEKEAKVLKLQAGIVNTASELISQPKSVETIPTVVFEVATDEQIQVSNNNKQTEEEKYEQLEHLLDITLRERLNALKNGRTVVKVNQTDAEQIKKVPGVIVITPEMKTSSTANQNNNNNNATDSKPPVTTETTTQENAVKKQTNLKCKLEKCKDKNEHNVIDCDEHKTRLVQCTAPNNTKTGLPLCKKVGIHCTMDCPKIIRELQEAGRIPKKSDSITIKQAKQDAIRQKKDESFDLLKEQVVTNFHPKGRALVMEVTNASQLPTVKKVEGMMEQQPSIQFYKLLMAGYKMTEVPSDKTKKMEWSDSEISFVTNLKTTQ